MKRILLVLFVGLLLVGCSAAVSEAAGRTTLQDGDGVEIDMATSAVGSAYTGGVSVQGGVAETTVPTAVTDGQAAALWVDEYGRQVIKGANVTTGSLDVEVIAPLPVGNGSMLIIDETLDADPTNITSPAVFVGDCTKVSFLISTVIDRTGETVQVDYTFEASPDNSAWISAYVNEEDTTTAVLTVDHQSDSDTTKEVVLYIPHGATSQYIRVVATGTDTDADDTAAIDVWLNYQK